ncbi:MAG: restriction endonuclease subunit S [Thaumarchaeota archaeon]|nr:restriction endonuclease subunit S [Nitrososphaerota archaeon]
MTTNKLGLLTTKIGSGVTPRGGQSVYQDSGTHLIRSQNIYNHKFEKKGLVCISQEIAEKMKSVEIMKDDVLINITGDSVARVYLVPDEVLPARVNQHVCILRTTPEFNPHYLYYFLINPITQNHLLSIAGIGGTRNALTKEMLYNLIIEYPDYSTQEKIVKQLNAIKNKIIVLQNQNHTLEQMAQAIFQSWFVDFDGVTEWDDSELGKIPKGWTIETIGDFGEIITGKTPPTKNLEYYGNEYSFITIPDMHDKTWILKTERYLSEKSKNDFSKYFLAENSVLVSCIATVGLVSLNSHTALTNQQINSIVCSKNIPYTFVYCTMTRLKDQLITWASGGSATPNLNKGHFNSISVLVPHSKVLENFHNITKNLFEKIQKNSDNIIHLTKTRDILLPKLMSGEIRV